MTTTTFVKQYKVICPDGRCRHEPVWFETRRAAAHWADWGHLCLSAHLHVIHAVQVPA